MDPPYTIETFMETLSKLAVHVTNDQYFEEFVERLRDLSLIPQTFSPTLYDHETVLVCVYMPKKPLVLQPSLELVQSLGYTIVEAREFYESDCSSCEQVNSLLEELLCH